MNNKTKQVIIMQNITACKVGFYQNCLIGKSLKTSYVNNFSVGDQPNICNVYVVNQHAIDAIQEFCTEGTNQELKEDWMNPVAMCVVNRSNFLGTNFPQSEGITDDIYNLRTNFNMITSNGNPFPLKEKECVYNKFITTIRDSNLQAIPVQNTYKFGVIVISPINKPSLLDELRMGSNEFLNTMTTLETLFQTAIYYGHNILLLTPFGHTSDDVPQEDVIKIYNSLIFKYQHRFTNIIFCIPPWDGYEMFKLYEDNIIIPQDICDEEINENNDEDSESEEDNNVQLKIKKSQSNRNERNNNL